MSTGGAAALADKVAGMRGGGQKRVIKHWGSGGRFAGQWFDVPAVLERWATMVSGDPKVNFRQKVARTYLADGTHRRALSLGCGFGHREREWAQLNVFDELTGIDIAPGAVEAARTAAVDAGISPDILRYEVGDFSAGSLGQTTYDVIIVEHSLHHFTDVPGTVERIRAALAPGGLLVMDEYVGPSRFQWTSRQIEAADGLLRALPESYRAMRDGRLKRAVRRPSLLAMHIDDPSEAVESASIMPALRRTFAVTEEVGYGGAVLHPLLSNIAHNFVDDSPATASLLEVLFGAEDALLATGDVEHDFVAAVCRVP
jgi:SAM-dependent methyltransferase